MVMSRNLVICCDGTGNIWGNDCDTNVVKLARILLKANDQIIFYDPGVGTSDTYPSIGAISRAKARGKELLALAFGGGIYENIGQAYGFLVEHYQPGDRIFLFGFSRGAFTARCVAGMVNLFGIVRRGTETIIPTLTRIYFQPIDRKSKTGQTRKEYGDDIRAVFTLEGRDARVYFLGVWDTVSTVGGLPGSKKNITSSGTIEGKNYDHVRHAVATHEYRYAYAPRLFADSNFDHGHTSLKQLRFSGAHSDVGGSYREDGLSNCSFGWMLEEAIEKGLRCDMVKVRSIQSDALGLAHDQVFRQPLWALTGLRTRLDVMDIPPHPSLNTREKAMTTTPFPKTDWKSLKKNPRALVWIGAMFVMGTQVHLLSEWACLSRCQSEFNVALLLSFIDKNLVAELLSTVNPGRMTIRYLVDYLFIAAYAGAACWLLIYARRIVGDLSTSASLHRAAHWSGLIPLWALIGSDVAENTLTLILLNGTLGTYAGSTIGIMLTVSFTSIKILALMVLCAYFAWISGWALLARKGLVRRLEGSSIPA